MKKLFAIALFLVMLVSLMAIPAFAAGNGVQFVLTPSQTGEVRPGDTFDVTIHVNNNSGYAITSWTGTFSLPTGFKIVKSSGNGVTINAKENIFIYLENTGYGNAETSWDAATITVEAVAEDVIIGSGEFGIDWDFVEYTPDEGVHVDVFDNNSQVTVSAPAITITHDHHMVADPNQHEDATCGKDGKDVYICDAGNGCTETRTDSIPATGQHTYAYKYEDATGHWQECSVCGNKTDKVPHDSKPVPNEDGATHSAKCDTCGYVSDKENHSSSAAPKSDGTNHWYVCDACEAVFGKEAHAFGDWVQGETTHYKECEVCKVKSEEAEHTWKPTGETTATCTKPGDSDVVCTTCGKESKIEGKPLDHLYEGEPVVVPATCEKDGTSTRTCVRPGCDGGENGNPYVDVKVLPALGHDFTGEVYTEKCVDPTYLTAGVKATKCVRFDECGKWEEEPIPKLELTDDVLKVTVDPVPEFVNNKAVMDELQDTIESAVKDIADGNEPATVKTAFIEAVRDSLSKNEGDVSVAVTVSFEEVTDSAALPEKLQKDAEGMNFEAGWKLGITALVDGKTTVEDAMDALPVPAEYALSKPEYAAPIGVQFEDVSAGCFGYPAAKKDDAFLVEAQSAGYYALFTTGDLSSDYVCYNFTDVYAYTGSAIEPKVVVTINSGETVDPKYYNVEYKDNTNVTDKAQIIITLTDEGKAAGFTLEEALTFTFSITPAPATATPKPTGTGSTTNNNGNAPDTGDETNVALYAVVLAVCTAALVLVVTLRKKSSR